MKQSIALGGREFAIRPLTLGQLRYLLDALEDMAGKSGGGLIEAAAKVVAAGLAPSHPDATADALLDLEASVDDLNAAVAVILRVAGLRPKDADPGEVPPVASPSALRAANSAPSTPPSPPAAATPIATSTG